MSLVLQIKTGICNSQISPEMCIHIYAYTHTQTVQSSEDSKDPINQLLNGHGILSNAGEGKLQPMSQILFSATLVKLF